MSLHRESGRYIGNPLFDSLTVSSAQSTSVLPQDPQTIQTSSNFYQDQPEVAELSAANSRRRAFVYGPPAGGSVTQCAPGSTGQSGPTGLNGSATFLNESSASVNSSRLRPRSHDLYDYQQHTVNKISLKKMANSHYLIIPNIWLYFSWIIFLGVCSKAQNQPTLSFAIKIATFNN